MWSKIHETGHSLFIFCSFSSSDQVWIVKEIKNHSTDSISTPKAWRVKSATEEDELSAGQRVQWQKWTGNVAFLSRKQNLISSTPSFLIAISLAPVNGRGLSISHTLTILTPSPSLTHSLLHPVSIKHRERVVKNINIQLKIIIRRQTLFIRNLSSNTYHRVVMVFQNEPTTTGHKCPRGWQKAALKTQINWYW